MAKGILSYNSFDKVTKTITFNITDFNIKNLYAVIDVTNQNVIYAASLVGKGYESFTTNSLVLQYDTNIAAFNNTDELLIIYEVKQSILTYAKGTTLKGNPTSTDISANIQALDTKVHNLGTIEGILDSIDTKLDILDTSNIPFNVNVISGGGTIGAALEATQTLIRDNQINGSQITKIIDTNGSAITVGNKTMVNSLPTTIASDDLIQGKLGIVTETAPATDTASSGLNGRL